MEGAPLARSGGGCRDGRGTGDEGRRDGGGRAPVRAERRDGAVLQEFLKARGCNGVEAVPVTMKVVGCGLAEAQAMCFAAPCRAAERDFHNAAVEALERDRDDAR